MAYNHGVKISEVPTSILPPAQVEAAIPFIVGTAPVNMTDPTARRFVIRTMRRSLPLATCRR